MSIEHPFFNSYKKNTNNISKNDDKLDFVALYENLNFISKEKIARGESVDIVSELNSYAGNISTKQLKNIDYSKFSNHTFFDSAVHKVSYAFNEIINFPYDKPEQEVKKYLSDLDGYTEYVLHNIYPKYTGHIQFDGETKIVICDRKGILLNDYTGDLSKRDGFLSPSNKDYSFSFHLKVPSFDSSNSQNQTIFKKTIVNNQNEIVEGYFCYVKFLDNNNCLLKFGIKPANNDNFFISDINIEYDKTSFININVNVLNDKFNVDFFVNGNIQEKNSSNDINYETFSKDFKNKDVYFILGSGDSEIFHDVINDTLESSILGLDEFIYFNKNRDNLTQKLWKNENIFTDAAVLLYLKFNEPGGDHTNSSLVLDASGNKLHGLILDVASDKQITDTTAIKVNESLLTQEDLKMSPVILGTYSNIITTRDSLLNTAKKFDADNSNIIFNLLPLHYFTNNSNFENKSDFISPDIVIENSIGFVDNTTQKNTHITNLCLIWARFFDQLKLYVDALSGLYDLDYDSINREDFVNSQMHLLCKMYGFDFKEININKTNKKSENKNLTFDDIVSEVSLIKLQNIIWKKILMNSQSIIRSKGTLKSIDFLFNSVGFDAKKYTNIEEKSYENFINIEDRFSYEKSKFKMLDFGKNINVVSAFNNNNSIDVSNKPILKVENIKTNDNNNVIGGVNSEFSVEAFFDFNKLIYNHSIYKNEKKYNVIQSIFRLNDENNNCFLNCFAKFGKNTDTNFDLILEYIPYNTANNDLKQTIMLTNLNAYDMEHYVNISFKYDNVLNTINMQLLHGFVGDVIDKNTLSKAYKTINVDFLSNNQSLLYMFKNNFSLVTGEQDYTDSLLENSSKRTIFEGRLVCVRLWKKMLSYNECLLHSKDIFNISEDNLAILRDSTLISNFLFNSYEHADKTDSNNIVIISANYSRPYVELNVDKTELNKLDIKFNEDYTSDSSLFSFKDIVRKKSLAKIDVIDNNHLKRVRILSYNDEENKKAYDNFESYPTHNIPVDYNSYKTNYLSIDMSVTKAIDDSISNLINNIDQFSKLLSSNLGIYQDEYHLLNQHRKDYFDKYLDAESSVNFEEVNNLYKYFDTILNSILFSLIPQNINFKGFNLVYESHILERAKYQHKNKDSNISVHDIYDYKTTRLGYNDVIAKRDLNYKEARMGRRWLSIGTYALLKVYLIISSQR